tara:strand:+ start:673 stop:966 length:294 start_codon:yes stop_codon:yes gene_type:complete
MKTFDATIAKQQRNHSPTVVHHLKMNKITISLSKDEAIILTEFLLRFQEEENLDIKDKSEEIALWNLGAILESNLPEILDPNYKNLLIEARKNIQKK